MGNTKANKTNMIVDKVIRIAYYVCFFYIYNYLFFTTSMLSSKAFGAESSFMQHLMLQVNKHMTYMIHLSLALSILAIALYYRKVLEKIAALTILSLASAFLFFHDFHYSTVVAIVFLALAAKNKSAKTITSIALFSGTFWLLISYICTRTGYIEDLVYMTPSPRHSFGIGYCTDFISHVLFLVLALFLLRDGKCKIKDYVLFVLLNLMNIIWVKGKIALICFVLLGALTLYYQFVFLRMNKIKQTKAMRYVGIAACLFMMFSAIILTIVQINITKAYSETGHHFYDAKFLKTLKLRYMFGSQAYEMYEIGPWGTAIREQGYGGSTEKPDFYFALDISYIKILFSYGKVMLGMLLFLFTYAQFNCFMRKKYYMMIILFVVAVDSAAEHHFYNVCYNTFFILAFADLDIDGNIPFFSNTWASIKAQIDKSSRRKKTIKGYPNHKRI